MKKMIAGALFGLVLLGAERAEANMKLNLSVRSCDNGGAPWKQTDQDGRLGRVRVEDQAGNTVQTETNVHFSASRCQATFTMTFTDATMARFLDPDDPLFVTLEACKQSSASCTYAAGQLMDDKPVVFADAALDSLLPDVSKLHTDALLAEIEDRLAAGSAESAARIAADQAELARATAAEQALSAAVAAEIARATAAEQGVGGALAAEISRAIAAELAEEQARIAAIAGEAAARLAADQAEATARAAAILAERDARIAALTAEAAARAAGDADEAAARLAADEAEATVRAAGDQDVRDYADGTFLPKTGGTVDGELVVTGMLRLQGGVSWDACPAGLDSVEHEFPAAGGGSNRLCASDLMQTEPSVRVNEVLGSYIEPICPLVVQVVQNYTEVGGPAAIEGVNTLLQTVTGLLNNQITPFANELIGASTEITNDLIDSINGKLGEVNALLAAHTAGINDVIAAYNGLVAEVNAALTTSTNGLNGSITAINGYLSAVRDEIDGVVAGINGAVGDVNGAFAAIDTSLGSASDALNAFNNSPTGINNALGSLTTSLNARIGTINGLLDNISSAHTSLTASVNGAITSVNQGFSTVVTGINTVSNGLRGTIHNVNHAITVLDDGAINVGNYLVNWLNGNIIGPQSHANRAGINGVLSWVQTTTAGAVNFPWFAHIPTVGSTTATDHNIGGWEYGIQGSPGAALISAPAAIGHLGTVGAPSIGSLGLPAFDLGLNGASMSTVSHSLSAPALGGVLAPQLEGATVGTVDAPAIPGIPDVAIPVIPAFEGFQLVGAIDFDAISALIGSTMEPVCADIEGTAQGYLDAFLGDVPALVPAYADAEEACGSLGAHVCSATEITLLAGDDGTPMQLGYALGDWTGDGLVLFNPRATSGLMIEVAWPFLHPDASKLMTFPPGFPFTFTPPVLPTGNFRCCASSAAFE